jgi:hypothetical protein
MKLKRNAALISYSAERGGSAAVELNAETRTKAATIADDREKLLAMRVHSPSNEAAAMLWLRISQATSAM